MRIGVAPHRLWPDGEGELDEVIQTAVKAEELGLDHVFASGHAVAGDLGVTPDPLVLLAAVAGATRRIGLVTSILVLPLYNPLLLAHQTATLDRLSGGPGV
ncbi:LLM class flavin-dependent oxidoreductase [Streptomyces sp. NPDC048504]|uniref:LLM class flavin-dependent oxidoreductase n=1 Tax=Streptomyces sp. NPDC048504 TaxID=3365559 RepID=UPI0037200016